MKIYFTAEVTDLGKFDGILICSDIDGTILENSTFGSIFEKNAEAVKHFTDNGGRFTFITGRYKFFLRDMPLYPLINAPAGIFNGAAVYDYQTETLLYARHIEHTCEELADAAKDFRGHLIRITYPIDTEENTVQFISGALPAKLYGKKPLKCIYVFDNEQSALEFKNELLNESRFDDCHISRSWNVSVELTSATATKGHAAKYIKEFTGARTLVTIGDYENDIPMLKLADIGAAVGSAPDSVKSAADIIVKPCCDGAIFDLIELLSKKTNKSGVYTI